MPVSIITGPTGLSKEEKRELIEGSLRALAKESEMPDNRVYIHEVPSENVGHTPVLEVTYGKGWALVRELTEVAKRVYELDDGRDVLVSIDQHPVEDFAANGYLQTENPDMAAFAGSLFRQG
jgi:phenylpyruvate tautomerase PptA (4-oxalocrotonate tautomerase family)